MYGDIDVLELEGAWKWKEVGHVPGCIEFIQLGDASIYSMSALRTPCTVGCMRTPESTAKCLILVRIKIENFWPEA